MRGGLFGDREGREAERVHAIVEQAKKAPTPQGAIIHLQEFLRITKKSRYQENYDPDFPVDLVAGKIMSGLDINRLKESLDRVFAPREQYRPLEDMLAGIGLRKEAIYSAVHQLGENAIDVIFQGIVADMTAGRLQGAYHGEYIHKAAGVLNFKDRLREDFGLQQPKASDRYVRACLDYGMGMLEAVVARPEQKDMHFLDSYLGIRNKVGQIRSRLDLAEAAEQQYLSALRTRDEHAAMQQLGALAVGIKDADKGWFSDAGMAYYEQMLENVHALVGEQGIHTAYVHQLGDVKEMHARKKTELEPGISKEQDALLEKARQAAKSGSADYAAARDQFVQFSQEFSRILEEDDTSIREIVQPLESAYRIAYHQNARQFVARQKEKN